MGKDFNDVLILLVVGAAALSLVVQALLSM
jgi:hypothetical protein